MAICSGISKLPTKGDVVKSVVVDIVFDPLVDIRFESGRSVTAHISYQETKPETVRECEYSAPTTDVSMGAQGSKVNDEEPIEEPEEEIVEEAPPKNDWTQEITGAAVGTNRNVSPWWLLLILVLVAGLTGSYYYYKKRNAKPKKGKK